MITITVESAGVAFSAQIEGAVSLRICEPEPVTRSSKADFTLLLQGAVKAMGTTEHRHFSMAELVEIAREQGAFVELVGTDPGAVLSAKQKQAFGFALKGQLGKTHREIPGLVIEFGKRQQSRQADYTVTVSKAGSQ